MYPHILKAQEMLKDIDEFLRKNQDVELNDPRILLVCHAEGIKRILEMIIGVEK